MLQTLSRGFRKACPWVLLYADDLMISGKSKEKLLLKIETWKLEKKKKDFVWTKKVKEVNYISLKCYHLEANSA